MPIVLKEKPALLKWSCLFDSLYDGRKATGTTNMRTNKLCASQSMSKRTTIPDADGKPDLVKAIVQLPKP